MAAGRTFQALASIPTHPSLEDADITRIDLCITLILDRSEVEIRLEVESSLWNRTYFTQRYEI